MTAEDEARIKKDLEEEKRKLAEPENNGVCLGNVPISVAYHENIFLQVMLVQTLQSGQLYRTKLSESQPRF